MNHVEHAWNALGRAINGRDYHSRTLQELAQALTDRWTALPVAIMKNLVDTVYEEFFTCLHDGGLFYRWEKCTDILHVIEELSYDVNVFSVNWYEGANSQYYGQSAANTRRVGEIVADFIRQLRNVTGASYDSQHLIGLSLGAHVCGFAGASLDGQLARITGMDPAGPCFRFSGPDSRLSKDDAVFVDVIHTDGDHLLQGGFGTELPMGDADFYPNGGENQPGCKRLAQQLLALITDGFKGVGSGMMCSHLRSQHLFRNSINPANSFKAYPCDTQDDYETCTTCGTRGCSRMGYHASPQQHGIYTLRTQSGPPYSFDF
ncbi:pancreatic lipase-related protein 2-like [Liolophura sinensis]|uniref:pancreatic lipase-related protein 2-like n=1 Tax=Liolophura sinensis TaxID=3198878 RepID=UPI003158586C